MFGDSCCNIIGQLLDKVSPMVEPVENWLMMMMVVVVDVVNVNTAPETSLLEWECQQHYHVDTFTFDISV